MQQKRRVAIYCRVSTLNGHQSPELQLNDLRPFAESRGWSLVGEYIDQGVSGAKDSRPALNRLMADAKQRKFDVVLVWKIDRWGRSLKHIVKQSRRSGKLGRCVCLTQRQPGFDFGLWAIAHAGHLSDE